MKKLGASSDTPFMPVMLSRSISSLLMVVTVTGWRNSERDCFMAVTRTSPTVMVLSGFSCGAIPARIVKAAMLMHAEAKSVRNMLTT